MTANNKNNVAGPTRHCRHITEAFQSSSIELKTSLLHVDVYADCVA